MSTATVKVEKGDLVIRIPMQTPTPSASGKTLVVASTHGFVKTDAVVNDKPISISLNAFIK